MMLSESTFNWENLAGRLELPVLIISTVVGRGMFSLGEAIKERLSEAAPVYHIPIEEALPRNAVAEDLQRYKMISNRFPFLLYLIYKVPVFYYRKYWREAVWGGSDLGVLKKTIAALNPKTVICISHRPAFWVSNLKQREGMEFKLWGVLGEYGDSLGWRYIFWRQMDGFLSPLGREELSYNFPAPLQFIEIALPARREFHELAQSPGDRASVLLVCGFWGQGPILDILQILLEEDPPLKIHAVCGENVALYEKISHTFEAPHVKVYGAVESLAPLLGICASVITKPGISTLLEAHAAGRKIFLLKGMPVAEDNNARYAVQYFGAEWFNRERFRRWRAARAQ